MTRPYRKKASTAVSGKSGHGHVHRKNADMAVTQLYSNKYLLTSLSCTFKRQVLVRPQTIPQISRRVRDTLARLLFLCQLFISHNVTCKNVGAVTRVLEYLKYLKGCGVLRHRSGGGHV